MVSLMNQRRREFPPLVRRAALRRSCGDKGKPHCEGEGCGKPIPPGDLIYEHVQPDGLGGEPTAENCKVYGLRCCAAPKTKDDNARMAKADRVIRSTYGLKPATKKIASAGFQRAPKQRSASRPLTKIAHRNEKGLS